MGVRVAVGQQRGWMAWRFWELAQSMAAPATAAAAGLNQKAIIRYVKTLLKAINLDLSFMQSGLCVITLNENAAFRTFIHCKYIIDIDVTGWMCISIGGIIQISCCCILLCQIRELINTL